MLESLEKSAEEMIASVNEILLAITDEAVPKTVLARMKGEQVDGDAPGMLKKMVEDKLVKLDRKIRKIGSAFGEYKISFPVRGKDLELEIERSPARTLLRWGNILIYNGRPSVGSMQDHLQFLGAYDTIEAKMERFAILMEAFKVFQA